MAAHPREALNASLDSLTKTVATIKANIAIDGYGLSHREYADRIHSANTFATMLNGAFSEAVHQALMYSIGHDGVDAAYPKRMEEVISDLLSDGYDKAQRKQRELAEEARRERKAA